MKKKLSLFGEEIFDADCFSDEIIKSFKYQNYNTMEPNFDTRTGFYTNACFTIPDRGIYCIFNNKKPLYVGYSEKSIRNRIGRFLSVVRNTQRHDENHPGAKRFLKLFGENLNNLSFKVYEIEILPKDIKITDIEKELIYKLNAILNHEVYKSLFVESASITLESTIDTF